MTAAPALAIAPYAVVVPYTVVLPEVRAALAAARWVDTSGSETAYWELLRDLWAAGEAFVLVEHDVVPAPDDLAGLVGCPGEWCTLGYLFEGRPYHGLGCVKFGRSLLARTPAAIERVARMSSPAHPARHWCSLDAYLQVVLRGAGARQHQHEGLAAHLRPGRSHGCGP